MSAASRVRLFHIGRASDEELHLELELVDDVLSDIKDQVNTFLSRNSTNERKERD